MKKIKRIIALVSAALMVFSLGACGKNQQEATTETLTAGYTETAERTENTRIVSVTGATAIGLVHLKETRSYSMDVSFVDSPESVYNKIKNNEADIAGLPLDLAAKLYNETNGGIKILSISAECSLYICSKTAKIENINDIKGKTLVASGENTYYQQFINSLLLQNNLEAGKDVEIEYLPSFSDVATKAMGEDAPEFCILPAHFAFQIVDTSEEPAEGKYISAISLSKVWEKTSELVPASECIVARTEYIEAHPDFIEEFTNYAEVSVNFITSNGKAGEYLVNASIFLDCETAVKAISFCNVVYIDGEEMKELAAANFNFLSDMNIEGIGGKIPDENIYYI